jgi:hypothetical protein
LIETFIEQHAPNLLAEEYTQTQLDVQRAESILQNIARRLNLPHIFVEPDLNERLTIGYRDNEGVEEQFRARSSVELNSEFVAAHVIAHQFPLRESFWLGKLSDHLGSVVLFVCGDIHLYSFPKLLEQKGWTSKVHASGIGVNHNHSDYAALQYALKNGMFEDSDCVCRKP